MGGTWLTADLHIGHAKCAGYRGLAIDDHDRYLAERWDETVRPEDVVWVLGDISIGYGPPEDRALDWISRRNGTKHLISGNHDSTHGMHTDSHKAQKKFLGVFESVQQSATRKIAGHKVRLSHFPFSGDHTAVTRYPEWRFPDDGSWIIHGHTHSEQKVRGRQIHVGVDAHELTPVSLHWIEKIIRDEAP